MGKKERRGVEEGKISGRAEEARSTGEAEEREEDGGDEREVGERRSG